MAAAQLIGKQFNKLKVIERVENDIHGNAQWKCICTCENPLKEYIIATTNSLNRGKVQSCGCYQRERTSQVSKIDITGKTVGNFTALEPTGNSRSGGVEWRCRCNLCGNENYLMRTSSFNANIFKHCGCQTCYSKGAEKIQSILDNNQIKYCLEKSFDDLRFQETNKKARFDFWVQDSYIIEYDGIQHFKAGTGTWDSPEKVAATQHRDEIKNKYCFNHNIPIIRIPYTHMDKITLEDLLPETSQFLLKEEVL